MKTTPKRIGIFGNFGGDNLGNEGTLEAFMLFLRRAQPDAELTCICTVPETIRRGYGIPAYPLKAPRTPNSSIPVKIWRRLADPVHIFRSLKNLDILIVPGTGILDDFGEGPLGIPLTVFNICLFARLRRIPICFVSVGAGPIRHPWSRWLMKSAARMAQYRSYRDTVSKDFMSSIGLDTGKDPIYPDLAFQLPSPPIAERPTHNPLTIGVGVMSYFGWTADSVRGACIYETYLEKMTRFIHWLLDRGHNVRLLIGEKCDQEAVDDLMTALHRADEDLHPARLIAQPTHSLGDLMEQIAQTDAVIATRFHNVVCTLKVGRPAISIGYAAKNDVLLQEMGLGEFCQHVETFDVDVLIEQFKRLSASLADYEKTVRETGQLYERRLEEQNMRLAEQMLQT